MAGKKIAKKRRSGKPAGKFSGRNSRTPGKGKNPDTGKIFIWFIAVSVPVFFLLGSAFLNRAIRTSEDGDREAGSQTKLEILNGCGVRGLADELREYFVDAGYDVVGKSNAEDFLFSASLVVVLKPEARTAGEELGRKLRVRTLIQYVDQSYADLSFIAGKDFIKIQRRLE